MPKVEERVTGRKRFSELDVLGAFAKRNINGWDGERTSEILRTAEQKEIF
jgi:hypothetical protein